MLRLMRDYASSWMIKVILGAIVIVFVFWGVGSFRDRKANIIAKVNGEVITLDDYRPVYNRLLDQMRQQFGNSLNDEMLEMLQVKTRALNQLIDQRLMLQKAADLDLRVTEDEIVDSIQKIRAFQSNGYFDNKAYARVLNFNRLTPEEFEEIQRHSLLLEKLQSLIFSGIQVSENEIQEYYKWKNASVDIDYILFEPDSYKDMQATDEEVQTYFDANKENYKTKPRAKVQYIHFDPEKYKDTITISDQDIAAYYQSNKASFENPKTVEARHILFRVAPEASDEEVAAKKAKAYEVYEKYKSGADFESLAKEFSEGPTKDNGGYLGTFKKEDMVAPFAEKAFSMKPGEVSEPVRTQFGWHLIKVEAVNEASVTPLEEAKKEIRDKLASDKAKGMAYDRAEAFYDTTMEGDNLKKIGGDAGLEVKTTPWFTASGVAAGVADHQKFAAAAFEMALDQISEILDLNDGYYILQVIEKEDGKIPDLAAVKETVTQDLVKEKRASAAENDAKSLLTALKEKGEEALKTKEKSYSFKSTGFFKRNEEIPEIGRESELSRAAFDLSKAKPYAEKVIKGRKGYYVIRLKDRILPDMQEYDKEKAAIEQTLLSQKKFHAMDTWLKEVREKSEITIQEDFIH
jgi:peptidyl-prolyl cis-trans isomerase D